MGRPLDTKTLDRIADLYAKNLTLRGIADEIGCSGGSVTKRIFRARHRGDTRFPARIPGNVNPDGPNEVHFALDNDQRTQLAASAAARGVSATRLAADLFATLLDEPALIDNLLDDGVQTPEVV